MPMLATGRSQRRVYVNDESASAAAAHAKSIGRPQLIIRKVAQVLIARLKWISNLAHRNLHLV